MTDQDTVGFLGGMLLVVYSIFASGYWQETARQEDKAAATRDPEERSQYEKNRRSYELVFRASSGVAAFVIVVAAVGVYFPVATTVCKYLLMPPLFAVCAALVKFCTGSYSL